MARIALISDIHGHRLGLERVLADLAERAIDRIVCLGDLIDGGDDDEGVVRWAREQDPARFACVAGNHDAFGGWLQLSDASRAYLEALPQRVEEGDAVFTHVSPRSRPIAIHDRYEAWNVFEEVCARRIFVGHIHRSVIYTERSEEPSGATRLEPSFGEPLSLAADDRAIVSVGAVAYPRDGLARIRYGIYDEAADAIEIHALEGPLLPLGDVG